jgi:hypothetical protein
MSHAAAQLADRFPVSIPLAKLASPPVAKTSDLTTSQLAAILQTNPSAHTTPDDFVACNSDFPALDNATNTQNWVRSPYDSIPLTRTASPDYTFISREKSEYYIPTTATKAEGYNYRSVKSLTSIIPLLASVKLNPLPSPTAKNIEMIDITVEKTSASDSTLSQNTESTANTKISDHTDSHDTNSQMDTSDRQTAHTVEKPVSPPLSQSPPIAQKSSPNSATSDTDDLIAELEAELPHPASEMKTQTQTQVSPGLDSDESLTDYDDLRSDDGRDMGNHNGRHIMDYSPEKSSVTADSEMRSFSPSELLSNASSGSISIDKLSSLPIQDLFKLTSHAETLIQSATAHHLAVGDGFLFKNTHTLDLTTDEILKFCSVAHSLVAGERFLTYSIVDSDVDLPFCVLDKVSRLVTDENVSDLPMMDPSTAIPLPPTATNTHIETPNPPETEKTAITQKIEVISFRNNARKHKNKDKENTLTFASGKAAAAEAKALLKAVTPEKPKSAVYCTHHRVSNHSTEDCHILQKHKQSKKSDSKTNIPPLMAINPNTVRKTLLPTPPNTPKNSASNTETPAQQLPIVIAPKLISGLALLLGDSHFRRFFEHLIGKRYHNCLAVAGNRTILETLKDLQMCPLPGECPNVFVNLGTNDILRSLNDSCSDEEWIRETRVVFLRLLRQIFKHSHVKHVAVFSGIVSPPALRDCFEKYKSRFLKLNDFYRYIPTSAEFKDRVSFVDISFLYFNRQNDNAITTMFGWDSRRNDISIHLNRIGNERLYNRIQEHFGHRVEPPRQSHVRDNSAAPPAKRYRR